MSISSAVREASEHLDKWMCKEPWRNRLVSFHENALADIADILDLSIEQMMAQGTREGWEARLVGALVDFFFELDFPEEPVNVVDDYLRRRGWKETKVVREYMQAVRSTSFSLYYVKAAKPGVSMTLVDKVRNLPAVEVAEKQGSQHVSKGYYVLAKVIQVSGTHYLSGGFFLLRPSDAQEWIEEIAEALEEDEEKTAESVNSFLQEFTIDLLADAVDFMLQPFPVITNMQGESLLFTNIRFPLKDKGAVTAGLENWPDLNKEEHEKHPSWVWLEPQPKFKNSFTVLGNITVQGKWLKAEVNSKERGELLLERLQSAFPEALGKPVVTHQSFESAMRESKPNESFDPIVDPEILNQVIAPRLEEHYRQTLDTRIPMLKNKSPRESVKTKAGRQRVIEWLEYIEGNHSKSETMPAYDFDWMWNELGLTRRGD